MRPARHHKKVRSFPRRFVRSGSVCLERRFSVGKSVGKVFSWPFIESDDGKIGTGKPDQFDGKTPWVSGEDFPNKTNPLNLAQLAVPRSRWGPGSNTFLHGNSPGRTSHKVLFVLFFFKTWTALSSGDLYLRLLPKWSGWKSSICAPWFLDLFTSKTGHLFRRLESLTVCIPFLVIII